MEFKLKNEVRAFRLSQFRNIGYGKDSDENSTLILNYSLNPNYMGDLVILIGPNNSGKSNILDALFNFSKRKILKRDFSDININDNNPELKLFASCRNNKKDEIIYEYQLNKENKLHFKQNDKVENEPAFNLQECIDNFSSDSKILFNDASKILKILKENKLNVFKENFQWKIKSNTYRNKYCSDYQVKNYLIKLKKLIDIYKLCSLIEIKKWINAFQKIEQNCSEYTNKFIDSYLKYVGLTINDKWLTKKPPTIIEYNESNIHNKDLKCDINEIENNTFFQNLISLLHIDKKQLINTYKKYKRNKNPSIFNQFINDFNGKLNKIKKLFNKLYSMGTEKNHYLFELQFMPPYLVFALSKYDEKTNKKTSLNLDYQSTGFKWFFNFFFNICAGNKFKPGDVIMIDEPATNLHVKGQEELHDFLKQFAIQAGITFVIATHSPFLVNLDYLDEVRLVIPQDDNTSWINNSFTTVSRDDADLLLPIRESLTVRNSVLLDPNQIVIFVEGITDYNYFVAMKKLIGGFNNLTFLPINGLGKKEEIKEKLQQLHKIRTSNSLVLTDGDEIAKMFGEANGKDFNPLQVIKLTDINPAFTQIENLFSKEDQEVFNLKNKQTNKWNKSQSLSVTLKKIIQKAIWEKENNLNEQLDFISEQTINNFKKVFEYLNSKIKK